MWAIAAILLFLAEVGIATLGRDLPFVRGELGDFLVVILIYAAAKAVRPFPRTPLALSVFAFAVAIECAQALKLADVLGLTGVARIVLGTTFQWADILMYALGCLAVWAVSDAASSRNAAAPAPRRE